MNHVPRRRLGLALATLLAAGASASAVAASDARAVYDKARGRLDAGNPKLALEELDRWPVAAPTASTPLWTVPYGNAVVHEVLVGRAYGYLLFEINSSENPSCPLIVPAEDALIQDSTMGYDMRGVATCVDLRTGQLLWSRLTPGRMKCAIDPQSDDLCLWRERLFVIRASDGRLLLDVKGDEAWRNMDGIIREDRVILQGHMYKECLFASRYPRVYDMDREVVREVDAFRAAMASPDRRKRLALPLRVFEVSDLPASQPEAPLLWTYDGALSRSLPVWHGEHILATSGNAYSKGVVHCFDGLTGKVRWQFTLPRGLCEPKAYQLAGGAYPPDSWDAAGPLGAHIVALDGSGQMFFLDPSDGRAVARSSLVDRPLSFPVLLDGAIIVSDQKRMRAVPLDDVLSPAAFGPKHLRLLRAEAMLGLGQAAAAEETLRGLIDQYPDWLRPWELLGEVFQTLERPQEELAARCRALALTGRGEDSRLLEAWGLLRRISIGEEEIIAPVALFEGKVYCGTKGGSLWEVDATSLDATRLGERPTEFTALASTRQLSSNHGLIREARTTLERPVVPEELTTFLAIIRERTATDTIILSSTDGLTLAFVRRHWPTATLEIWSHDGARRLRSETLQRCPNPGALMPLADGYLVTGDDLVWVPCDERRAVWRFGSRTELPRAVPAVHFQHVPNYGLPVVVDGRMFVGCRDGALYVFDVGRITGVESARRLATRLPVQE